MSRTCHKGLWRAHDPSGPGLKPTSGRFTKSKGLKHGWFVVVGLDSRNKSRSFTSLRHSTANQAVQNMRPRRIWFSVSLHSLPPGHTPSMMSAGGERCVNHIKINSDQILKWPMTLALCIQAIKNKNKHPSGSHRSQRIFPSSHQRSPPTK